MIVSLTLRRLPFTILVVVDVDVDPPLPEKLDVDDDMVNPFIPPKPLPPIMPPFIMPPFIMPPFILFLMDCCIIAKGSPPLPNPLPCLPPILPPKKGSLNKDPPIIDEKGEAPPTW